MNLPKASEQARDALGPAPNELQLQLAAGQSFSFTVQAAEAGEVQWDISQIGSGSRRLAAGEIKTIPLTVPPTAQPRSLIRGQVVIRRTDGTPLLTIQVAGWVRAKKQDEEDNRQTRVKPEKRPLWVKLVPVSLALAVVTAVAVQYFQRPTLVVKPARVDFGTLWYSPPVGGHIETAIVFTAQWRASPRSAENLVLVARRDLRFSGQTGEGWVHGTPIIFPLNNEVNEARIPLVCYDLSNETVRVSGTVSLAVSNAHARVLPSEIQFKAEFKPAAKPRTAPVD